MVNFQQDRKQMSAHNKYLQLASLFSRLGTDPVSNIDIILEQACHILEGYFSVYHRIDDKRNFVSVWASYNKPRDFYP